MFKMKNNDIKKRNKVENIIRKKKNETGTMRIKSQGKWLKKRLVSCSVNKAREVIKVIAGQPQWQVSKDFLELTRTKFGTYSN